MQVNVEDQRLPALTEALLDRWQLSDSERAGLVGEWPVHELSEDVRARSVALLEMHSVLRRLFPRDSDLRYAWVSTRNAHFHGQRPLDVMIAEREPGIRRVQAYLMSHLQ